MTLHILRACTVFCQEQDLHSDEVNDRSAPNTNAVDTAKAQPIKQVSNSFGIAVVLTMICLAHVGRSARHQRGEQHSMRLRILCRCIVLFFKAHQHLVLCGML